MCEVSSAQHREIVNWSLDSVREGKLVEDFLAFAKYFKDVKLAEDE